MPPTITDPGNTKYPVVVWRTKPFLGLQLNYEKYDYDDETLEDIATKHGLTWQDLAFANWGVTDIAHVNWYLSQRHTADDHPKTEAQVGGNASFKLLKKDDPHFLWVPRDRRLKSNNASKKRQPSPFALGHVAPADTDKFPDQVNTLAHQPVYEISLELGDLDALFDPMTPSGAPLPHIAHSAGIQQRLQVLGYFYWPLKLSNGRRNGYAEAAWDYYKKVHAWARATPLDATFTVATTSITKNGAFATSMLGHTISFMSNTHTVNGVSKAITAATANRVTFAAVAGLAAGDKFVIRPPLTELGGTHTVTTTSITKNGAFSPDMVGDRIRFYSSTDTVGGQSRDITAATANQVTFKAVTGLAAGDKFLIEPRATDAQAWRILRFEVRSNVIAVLRDNNRFPKKGDVLDGRLPKAEKPGVIVADRGTDEFALIRVPGGYTFNWPRPGARVETGEFDTPNAADADATYDVTMDNSRYEYEQKFYKDNEFLGRIPLVAKVERVKRDGKREPASGVSVYFQLVTPDAVNRNPLRSPTLRRVEMDRSKDWETDAAPYTVGDTDLANNPTKGPAKFIHDTETNKPALTDANDPQGPNAPKDYGGKRGLPVEGEGAGVGFKPGVFEVNKERKGLHSKRDDDHSDYGAMTVATTVPDEVKTDHKHAVIAKTSDKGYAGVVFMPARMGGDTYRLRAYVGPETLGFKGDSENGPVVETGTMTVWRNIRFCGYHRKKMPTARASVSANVKDLFADHATNPDVYGSFNTVWGLLDHTAYYDMALRHGTTKHFAKNRLTEVTADGAPERYRPVDVDFKSLTDVFRDGYCELVLDATGPAEVSDTDYKAAVQLLRDAVDDSGEVGKDVDWGFFILDDPTSPFTITTRSLDDYNTNRPDKGTYPDDLDDADLNGLLFLLTGLSGFAEHFTDGGRLPGITLLHLPWDQNTPYVLDGFFTIVGFGGPNGGFYMMSSNANPDQMDTPLEGGSAHEGGHCLFHVHAPTEAPGNKPPRHQAVADCRCVMDYSGCSGDFCGRCLLQLRGWKTQRTGGDGGA